MREDMFKVIVERPRSGRSWATKSKLRYDKCEDRSRVTGHRLVTEHSGGTKNLNENLAPLKRYLHKQVGRVWNDVFSEICRHLDTGSTVKMHVREHLDDFVLRHVRHGKDGDLIATSRWGRPVRVVDSWVELYVDPADGLLKKTRAYCARQGLAFIRARRRDHRWVDGVWGPKPAPKPVQKLAGNAWHVRLNGIWYRFDLSRAPICERGYAVSPDRLYDDLSSNQWRTHDRWRVTRKKQLCKKELSKFGLCNKAGSEVYYG